MPPSHAACSVACAVASSTRTNNSPNGAQPIPIVVTSNGVRPRRRRGSALAIERKAVGIDIVALDMAAVVLSHENLLLARQTEAHIRGKSARRRDPIKHAAIACQHGHIPLPGNRDVKLS